MQESRDIKVSTFYVGIKPPTNFGILYSTQGEGQPPKKRRVQKCHLKEKKLEQF